MGILIFIVFFIMSSVSTFGADREKDENNNAIAIVDRESKCAISIIEKLPNDMQNVLARVREFALKQIIDNFNSIYFPKIIADPFRYPRNMDIIEYIELMYPEFANENIKQREETFRKFVNYVLTGPVEDNVAQQMLLIGAVGQELVTSEYNDFMRAIGTMRRPLECPNTLEPRIARQNAVKYSYRGIYALQNPAGAEAFNFEHRKIGTLNGINVWMPNENNCFIKALREAGLPAVAGPSGSVGPLMNTAIQANLSPAELLFWKILSAASTVESGNHSFAEALYSADFFITKRKFHGEFFENYDEQIAELTKICPDLNRHSAKQETITKFIAHKKSEAQR